MKREVWLDLSKKSPAAPAVFAAGRRQTSGLAWVTTYRRPVVLLLLFFAFCLRAYALDSQSLRGDEAATVHYSAMPVSGLWELSRVTDPHPPLYYLLLHPWQWGLGEGAWTMRFAGVLASVLAVAVLYDLARRTLASTLPGLLAAGLLAANPLQVWLAQDVRSYALFTLLGLLSARALWSALHRSKTPIASVHHASRLTFYVFRFTPWVLYGLFTIACYYTHYYTVFLIAFEGLFVLLHARKFRASIRPWLVSQLIIGLAILPGLGLAYNFVGQAAGGIETIATADILRLASTALLTGFTIGDSWGLWASLLLAPVWLAGLLSLLRRDRVSGAFWALFFALPVLGVIALSIGRPFFKERFLVQAQPAFEVLLAAGFLAAARIGKSARQVKAINPQHVSRFTLHAFTRFLALLLLILLLASNVLALNNYFTNPAYAKATPWRLYHDYIDDHARPGDVVLTNFPEAAVSYYSPNGLPFYVVPAERDRSAAFRLEQTAAVAASYRRIWFLPLMHQGFDEEGETLKWLDRHADRVNQVFFPSYNLNLYLGPAAINDLLVPQPATFAHGLHLRGYQILDEEGDSRLAPAGPPGDEASPGRFLLALEPGDEFTLSLYWSAAGPTQVPYTVFTHLIAPDGFTRTSRDNQPVWGSYPTTGWQPGEQIVDKYTLTVPEGTPAGEHSLRIGWYQSDTLERLPRLDAAGPAGSDQVILNVIIRVE